MSLSNELLDAMLANDADEDTALTALAALAGSDELDTVLSGEAADQLTPTEDDLRASPPAAYLASVEVTGFRGIGPTSRLALKPGPGLTVVAGRNGSGKSSFAEALEVVLTGDSWRWKNKSAEWKQGWRNLHHTDQTKAIVEFEVEGSPGYTKVWREWADEDRFASDGSTVVQAHGGKVTDLAGYGWVAAVEMYRPLLSHAELSVVADNPSSLFDALSGVLGVDELSAAADLLRKYRLERQGSLKEAKKAVKGDLIPLLEASEDGRAALAIAALRGRIWDLDAVEDLSVTGTIDESDDSLRRWAQLAIPDAARMQELASEIRSLAREVEALGQTEAGRASRIAILLKLALEEHREHGPGDCPVCGQGRLDQEWQEKVNGQVAELEEIASAYQRAQTGLDQAVRKAKALVSLGLPGDVDGLDAVGLRSALEEWSQLPEDPAAMPEHLEKVHGVLAKEAARTVELAEVMLREREDRWQPIGLALGRWSALARRGLAEDEEASKLRKAEDALNTATTEIRTRRFAPISEQAVALWGDLRLQSNVQLHGVELTGTGVRRRVDLKVTVDDAEGPALGVVSQGEVNCLALSLFFPRAMLPESPFRFIVIDDPVQAMDPARVDGLARVFAKVAETRQLVVFTHDDRLPDSLRRLALPHSLLQVTRRPNSRVDVRERLDPVTQYFLDARAVSRDEGAPDGVASRVVPGFCRSGIEAACMEGVRRRRLGKGESHEDVEALLATSHSTTALAALALFDDADAGAKVLPEINRKWGRASGDAFNDCKRGAHQGFSGSLDALISESQRLAEGLRTAK